MPIKLFLNIEGVIKDRLYTSLSKLIKKYSGRIISLDQFTNEYRVQFIFYKIDNNIINEVKDIIKDVIELSEYCYVTQYIVLLPRSIDHLREIKRCIRGLSKPIVKVKDESRMALRIKPNIYLITLVNEQKGIIRIQPTSLNRELLPNDLLSHSILKIRFKCEEFINNTLINSLNLSSYDIGKCIRD